MIQRNQFNIKYYCTICNADATMLCERCELVYYCSFEHQLKDYHRHEQICANSRAECYKNIVDYHLLFKCATCEFSKSILLHAPQHLESKTGIIKIQLRNFYTLPKCQLCYQDISSVQLDKKLISKIPNRNNGYDISYIRCLACINNSLTMCNHSLKCTLTCKQDELSKLFNIYIRLSKRILLKEIIAIIIDKLLRCSNCNCLIKI